MSKPEYRTVELGDAIISVKFLRGTHQGEAGWWCIRSGKNIEYSDIGFQAARYLGEAAQRPNWKPGAKNAASSVHMAFCDATGEGLSCPDAGGGRVALEGGMGCDAVGYVVIARRTRTERAHQDAVSEARH